MVDRHIDCMRRSVVLSGENQPEPPMNPVVPDLDMSKDSWANFGPANWNHGCSTAGTLSFCARLSTSPKVQVNCDWACCTILGEELW